MESKAGRSPREVVANKLGQTSEATAQVIIAKPADLNHAGWRGMLAAGAKQDIEEALSFVTSRRCEVIRPAWIVLADHLGEIVNVFFVPLELTDGHGYGVVAKSADSLSMGKTQFPLEIEFVWEADHQWHIKSYYSQNFQEIQPWVKMTSGDHFL